MNNISFQVSAGEQPNTIKVTFKLIVDSDNALMEKANLGKSRQTCKICGAVGEFQTWRLIEMRHGTRDAFRYFECPECITLQIESFPIDIGKYYPNEYYSYAALPMSFPKPGVKRDERMILDVGCGAGRYLFYLVQMGFVNLYGCDPFIPQDVKYANGVKIFKKTIHEMDGRYDEINLNDSFEHMSDPHYVFKSIDRLLKYKEEKTGPQEPRVVFILPVHPSLSVDLYGMYSFALDAPRHYFLYSQQSLEMLAEKYGFYLAERENSLNWGHLAVSRGYQMDIAWVDYNKHFNENKIFPDNEEAERFLETLTRCASAANHIDRMKFVFKRK